MIINKIGFGHWEYGINCQDAGSEFKRDDGTVCTKVLADGCSEGLHSEIGARLFCTMLEYNEERYIFDLLNDMFPVPSSKLDHLLFTFLVVHDMDDSFVVRVCGDGTIIKQLHDDTLEYQRFDFDGKPPYYEYNYFDRTVLSRYADGVKVQEFEFSKTQYKSIGIASDGIDYILNSPFRKEFESYLINRKAAAINRMINREQMRLWKQKQGIFVEGSAGEFLDDITIII